MNIAQAVNLEDIRGLALRRLPRLLFDYIDAGVAGGTAGVRKVIQTLSKEIKLVLAQIGCFRFDELGPQYLAAHAAGARFNYDKEIDHEPSEPAVAGPRERAATGVRPGRAVA